MSRGLEDKERGRQEDREIQRRRVWDFLAFALRGVLAAVVAGWIAARLNVAGIAPVGLLPLVIGVAVGSSVFWLSMTCGISSRARLLVAAGLFGFLTVLAEHAWLYRDFCRQWREARASQPQVAMFRPEVPWSPAEYFEQEATPRRLALWCIDAVVLVSSTVVTVLVWRRRSDLHLAGPM
jgi:hypothetical protein